MARHMFPLCALVLAFQAARGQEIVDPADLTAGLQGPGGQTQVRDFTLELPCAILAIVGLMKMIIFAPGSLCPQTTS
jgi:hypothetical protein